MREEREFEDRRRKEERAFQLQMMQLLTGCRQQQPAQYPHGLFQVCLKMPTIFYYNKTNYDFCYRLLYEMQ